MEVKKVAIILQQYSIVVKSVERKLKELGCEVDVIKPESDFLKAAASGQTDLFVLYLPKDSKNREEEEMMFQMVLQVCDVMETYGKNMVLIGERSYRENLMEFNPVLKDYEWVNRPIDMQELTRAIRNAFGLGKVAGEKHILIVDDDPTYAGMVRTWIKEFYKTDILTSGKQVLMFLGKKKVDLILLDYEMPIMNGSQVFQMLRRDSTTKNIPVVFLTGVGTADEVKQVLALKPDGYILKSTPREQILEYLAEKLK